MNLGVIGLADPGNIEASLLHADPTMKFLVCLLRATLLALSSVPVHAQLAPASPAAPSGCPTLLQHTVPRLQDEKPQPLCQYAGKVLLVVNTASYCGFTSQYEDLEALYAK